MPEFLDYISCPKDIKKIDSNDLPKLCLEIRELIVQVMSKNSGHLGASLGAVELAVGVHYVFDAQKDSIVWDVGHQAYAHKILTGRANLFSTIRQLGGLSGFPSRNESTYDDFGTGHSGTSISAVLGMALAKKIKGDYSTSIAIIGDGSLTGGMPFEALNQLSTEDVNVVVIINDNDMSIDPNVGGLQKHLNKIDSKNNLFTQLGFNYHGVYEGNDMVEVVEVLEDERLKKGVHIVHFRTKKGFGYRYSEDGNPTHWHAPGKFEIDSGLGSNSVSDQPKKYQDVVGEELTKHMESQGNSVVITPAMATGSGLKNIQKKFPNRFYDVGIAEQHAVTLSAGFATRGILPICVIYSTFLQRGYDQLIHDVALQNLKVVFLIDRAGLVGNDGATHHGQFDLAYLNCIPNITIYAPQNEAQLAQLIGQIDSLSEGPVAIRYPRGAGVLSSPEIVIKETPDYFLNGNNGRNLVVSIGAIGSNVSIDEGFDHLSLMKVSPIDYKTLSSLVNRYEKIVFIEDGVKKGGIAQSLISELMERGLKSSIKIIALPDEFIGHGSQQELYAKYLMDRNGIEESLNAFFSL